ncbi:hypothetical protein NIIDMKKI_06790 [Mycobacterium kansasii]|uniref:Uncharacterized protein n=1 Tax=Mycobacterium kansasii TaxID=1768 RepID=A0A7G1I5D8_MYCKA|nr:hypothetical protein NIIDMKKI_06790 [Mycobacterium kansasii]
MARRTGRSVVVNRILAITQPRGKVAEVRARRGGVRVARDDPELDHDAYLDKQG